MYVCVCVHACVCVCVWHSLCTLISKRVSSSIGENFKVFRHNVANCEVFSRTTFNTPEIYGVKIAKKISAGVYVCVWRVDVKQQQQQQQGVICPATLHASLPNNNHLVVTQTDSFEEDNLTPGQWLLVCDHLYRPSSCCPLNHDRTTPYNNRSEGGGHQRLS